MQADRVLRFVWTWKDGSNIEYEADLKRLVVWGVDTAHKRGALHMIYGRTLRRIFVQSPRPLADVVMDGADDGSTCHWQMAYDQLGDEYWRKAALGRAIEFRV